MGKMILPSQSQVFKVRNILIPLFLSLLFLQILFLIYFYTNQESNNQELSQEKFNRVKHTFERAIRDDIETMSATLKAISSNSKFQQLYTQRQKEELFKYTLTLFESLKQSNKITHFYFMDVEQKVFLRVHHPQRDGDLIRRSSMQQAVKSEQIASGLELGPLGTYTLRTVLPWKVQGKTIGYIELGQEIEHIINSIQRETLTDLAVFIELRNIQREQWQERVKHKGFPIGWEQLADWAIIESTGKMLTMEDIQWLSKNNFTGSKHYLISDPLIQVMVLPIKNALDKASGRLLIFYNTRERQQGFLTAIAQIISITLLITIVLLVLFYQILSRIKKSLNDSIADTLEQSRKLQDIMRSTADAIYAVDKHGLCTTVNRACSELLGYTDENQLLGKSFHQLVHHSYADGNHYPETECHTRRAMETGIETCSSDEVYWRKDGRSIPVEYNSYPIWRDNQVIGAVVSLRDISERIQSQQTINEMVYYDSLTGLYKREPFNQRLSEAIARYKRKQIFFSVLLLDLDHFKDINDSMGHSIGDKLLKSVSHALQSVTRETDIVARLGGDEFIVLQNDISTATDAAILADKLIERISRPLQIDDHKLKINTSIGIVFAADSEDDADTIMKHADLALYHVKKSGRGKFAFHSKQMTGTLMREVEISHEIDIALQLKQFSMVYQPQLNLLTKELVGIEALIRWHHPNKGLISPVEFIPIAEKRGKIINIGKWGLNEVCRQARHWLDNQVDFKRVAFNVSAIHFKMPDFYQQVITALEKYQLPANCLELELTESLLIEDIEYIQQVMDKLSSLGIVFSIDDFGTGYSSLVYLKHLSVSTLKIDRVFITDIIENQEDTEITKAAIDMAKALHLNTVAEGIELETQARILEDMGCINAQGFLFSRPLAAEDFENWLIQSEKTRGTSFQTE